jgi:hypothetical protein
MQGLIRISLQEQQAVIRLQPCPGIGQLPYTRAELDHGRVARLDSFSRATRPEFVPKAVNAALQWTATKS